MRLFFLLSVFLFIITGHHFAKWMSERSSAAWFYVLLFYAFWIVVSMIAFLERGELKRMFRPSKNLWWNLLPFLFILPTFYFLFLRNTHLLKADKWLYMNAIICLAGPFLEEIYWRGLFQKIFGTGFISFFLSSFLFAASHPLIFGVNSEGDSGWPAFVGTFVVGAIWWWCYYKTKSLRGNVVTHILMDIAGMAVYVLTNQVFLMGM